MAALNAIELEILDKIADLLHSSFFDMVMPKISALGDAGWIWILFAVLFLIRKQDRKTGLTMILALIFSLITANMLLKPFVARARPFQINTAVDLLIAAPRDYSFPSGHTQSSFAAASAMYFNKRKAGTAALLLASLIGLSRLYLYLHFLSDVIAGAAIGYMLGGLADNLIGGIRWRYISKRRKRRGAAPG